MAKNHALSLTHVRPINNPIPADFYSATFALTAAAITKSSILIKGLDFNDHQGDKVVFTHLQKMGLELTHTNEGVWVKGNPMRMKIATEAIRQIEREAHTSGLTDRVRDFIKQKLAELNGE